MATTSRYTAFVITLNDGRPGKMRFYTIAANPDEALHQITESPILARHNIKVVSVKKIVKEYS